MNTVCLLIGFPIVAIQWCEGNVFLRKVKIVYFQWNTCVLCIVARITNSLDYIIMQKMYVYPQIIESDNLTSTRWGATSPYLCFLWVFEWKVSSKLDKTRWVGKLATMFTCPWVFWPKLWRSDFYSWGCAELKHSIMVKILKHLEVSCLSRHNVHTSLDFNLYCINWKL